MMPGQRIEFSLTRRPTMTDIFQRVMLRREQQPKAQPVVVRGKNGARVVVEPKAVRRWKEQARRASRPR
jgi:hypothetical protein